VNVTHAFLLFLRFIVVEQEAEFLDVSEKATSVKKRITVSGIREKCNLKKVFFMGFLAALFFSFLVAANCTSFEMVSGSTNVGGVLSDNTTWTLANSPYIITSTVKVPSNVTLTIEAGTVIISNVDLSHMTGNMFQIIGTIIAHGTVDKKITFDGSNSSTIFQADQSDPNTFLDLDYCIVRNGRSLWWWGPGHFSLTHSEISNLIDYSWVWYPRKNVTIEYNKFTDSAGFQIALGAANGSLNGNVSLRNNLFQRNIGYFVRSEASFVPTQVIVKYNSFSELWSPVLGIHYDSSYSAAMSALNASDNYWGTTNTSVIDALVYDKNDDVALGEAINYLPILQAPDPNTPLATTPAPSPSIAPTQTVEPSPTVPEFPSDAILSVVAASTIVGALIYRKRRIVV
jgi:hypothetical protein